MSLATRCLACGTIFRVVQDQLKVSEGWVRCGRCDEVFNALEGLFDLDRESPPRWSAPVPGVVADDRQAEPPPYSEAEEAVAEQPVVFEDHVHDVDAEPHPVAIDPALDDDPSPVADHDPASQAAIDRAQSTDAAEPPDDSPVIGPSSFTPTPAFVARAERDARWRQPGRLAGIAALILLLAAMLGAQAAHHFRDTVAARWPAARAPLQAWCEIAACRLEAPRRIDDIVVENTGLTRAVAGTDTYRIAVTLRNRGNQLLAMPFVDLTLTDNAGQLVARRALTPADFQRPAATIPTNADLPLQALISAGSAKVSGYTVEVFYP